MTEKWLGFAATHCATDILSTSCPFAQQVALAGLDLTPALQPVSLTVTLISAATVVLPVTASLQWNGASASVSAIAK
jgi:hypothetical protein